MLVSYSFSWELSNLVLLTEGKSVQEMVNEALRRVPNSDGWLAHSLSGHIITLESIE